MPCSDSEHVLDILLVACAGGEDEAVVGQIL